MRILLIEDEEKVARFIQKGLIQSTYTVDWAATGKEGLDLACQHPYAAILLDLVLPDMDGLEVVRELRKRGSTVPVLALTALDSVENRVKGLDSGCDDYLPKPFAFAELLARLRALLRRRMAATGHATRLECAGLMLDLLTRDVTCDGRPISLRNREYALLEMLLRHPGQVLTRLALLKSVWGYDFDTDTNVLEVYMNILRKKIEQESPRRRLHTIRGVGYVLREK